MVQRPTEKGFAIMKPLLAISCSLLLSACEATPLHLTYDTIPVDHAGSLTVLSATVETVEIRTLLVPPDGLRLQAECSVRESREQEVIEKQSVRLGISDGSFTHFMLSHADTKPDAGDLHLTGVNQVGAFFAVLLGVPLVAASVDLVSLTVTAPVTLTAAAFAGSDRDKS